MSCKEWKEYKLDKVYAISNGLSKKREEFGFGYEFLSFTEVFNNYFVPKKLNNLVNSSDKEREKYSIKRGDVFLTRTSEKLDELGRSCVALKDYPNATFNGFTKRLRPKGNVEILPEYAGYYFRFNKFKNSVTSMSSMTTRASLNNDMLSMLSITVPPIEEQERIANILYSLDNKIELNNDMNKTLEEIVQSIFKRWFVDFEFPNENGQPYKSSGGEMVESELGMIPKGWKVEEFGSVIDKIIDNRGKTPPRDEIGVPLIEGNNITMFDTYINTTVKQKYVNENTYKTWFRSGHPEHLDILCATVGTLPKWCLVGKNDKICIAQNIISLRVKKEIISPYYLKNYMDTNTFIQMFNGRITTTAQPSIKVGHLKTIKIIVPSFEVVKLYDNLVNNIYELIESRKVENSHLENLKSSLLPKLMAGEISIK